MAYFLKDIRKTDASVVGSPRRTTVLSSASRLASAILRKSYSFIMLICGTISGGVCGALEKHLNINTP